jgi:hypothetical protein
MGPASAICASFQAFGARRRAPGLALEGVSSPRRRLLPGSDVACDADEDPLEGWFVDTGVEEASRPADVDRAGPNRLLARSPRDDGELALVNVFLTTGSLMASVCIPDAQSGDHRVG